MILNKSTIKDIVLLCNDTINLLNNLKIDDEKHNENIVKILEKAKNCKNTINDIKPIKRKPSGYNKFISDVYKIKKEEETSGVLSKTIEEKILLIIQKNENEKIFKIAGDFWKYELEKLDKNAKNVYLGKQIIKNKKKNKNS